jgi:predicted metalloenzyme YecM
MTKEMWTKLYQQDTRSFEERLKRRFSDSNLFGQLIPMIISGELVIDHACVRLSNTKAVDSMLQSERLFDRKDKGTLINGREIPILELGTPLNILGQYVDVLELPYPGADYSFRNSNWKHFEGLEHIEVIAKPKEGVQTETLFSFLNYVLKILDIDIGEIRKAKYNMIFKTHKIVGQQPQHIITIQDRYKGTAIKFHQMSILETIKG